MIGFVDGTKVPQLRAFRGIWGSVHELPIVNTGNPDHTATLSHWFLSAPAAHPLWPHYLFFCVHLRDIEGQSKPPTRPTPDATHNIMLLALNPKLAPWTAENVVEKMLAPRDVPLWLTPLNISEFVRNATDAHALQLMALLARAMVDGYVAIEPSDVFGGRERWRETIVSTLEHIQTGGHAAKSTGDPQ